MHDVAATGSSGLLEGIDPSGWIADRGYIGRGMITPHKKPPNGELSETVEEANKSIDRIRQAVERTIAHIKAWRIHPHRPPAPPAHIRADHHRRTLTPRLQNHPLNKFHYNTVVLVNTDMKWKGRLGWTTYDWGMSETDERRIGALVARTGGRRACLSRH